MHSTILLEDCDGISVYCSEWFLSPISMKSLIFATPTPYFSVCVSLYFFSLIVIFPVFQFFVCFSLLPCYAPFFVKHKRVHSNRNRLFHANINPFEIDTAASLLQNIKWNLFRSLVLTFNLLQVKCAVYVRTFYIPIQFWGFYFIVWVYRCTDVQCAINSKTFRSLLANALVYSISAIFKVLDEGPLCNLPKPKY